LKHFSTQTKKVNDPSKKNVVIMGRKTYFGVPESKRPLPERFNVVLSTEPEKYEFPPDVIVAKSMDEALKKLNQPELEQQIENVWIVGGNSVYKEAMESENCHRVYFTKVMATFDCDAFFPPLPESFKRVANDEGIPDEVQEENGIKYQYQIYEKVV
jgi:dihydrofolate reductase